MDSYGSGLGNLSSPATRFETLVITCLVVVAVVAGVMYLVNKYEKMTLEKLQVNKNATFDGDVIVKGTLYGQERKVIEIPTGTTRYSVKEEDSKAIYLIKDTDGTGVCLPRVKPGLDYTFIVHENMTSTNEIVIETITNNSLQGVVAVGVSSGTSEGVCTSVYSISPKDADTKINLSLSHGGYKGSYVNCLGLDDEKWNVTGFILTDSHYIFETLFT